MNRVFVSGGAGVIGRELVEKLCSQNSIVFVGDLKPRPSTFTSSVFYRQGDLNTMTRQELDAFAPDVFIHLAATFERTTETYEFWNENFCHNVQLSHHLMTLAKDCPTIKRVVFASSYLIYEPSLYQFSSARDSPVSLRETDPVAPRNLTGMAKLAHEVELEFLEKFRSTQFSSVCARIYRGYGCGSRDVISRWVRSLLDDESIHVFRPEGLFDYIYAADSAEGLLRLAQSSYSGIVNLGTGCARRVSEVVEVLRQYFPEMHAITVDSDIPFEASQADTNLLETVTGWKTNYDISTAIPLIIEYERGERTRSAAARNIQPLNILVSSASRKIPLVKALQKAARQIHPKARVFAGDIDSNALSMLIADEGWTMPPLDSVDAYFVLKECQKMGINVVLPTRDGELMFWARSASIFRKAGIQVLVSEPESLNRCLDKLLFSEFAIANDLPVIPSSLSLDEIDSTRFVVKERFGSGSRSVGLNLTREEAISYAESLKEPIFQPYVAGEEISIDAWLDQKSHVKGLVLRRRDLVHNGESQVTTTFRDESLESLAHDVLVNLGLRGHVVLQAIIDSSGSFHVIECNARFGGASTASIAVGLDSLHWSLLESAGALDENYLFVRSHSEVKQIRIPVDTYE